MQAYASNQLDTPWVDAQQAEFRVGPSEPDGSDPSPFGCRSGRALSEPLEMAVRQSCVRQETITPKSLEVRARWDLRPAISSSRRARCRTYRSRQNRLWRGWCAIPPRHTVSRSVQLWLGALMPGNLGAFDLPASGFASSCSY